MKPYNTSTKLCTVAGQKKFPYLSLTKNRVYNERTQHIHNSKRANKTNVLSRNRTRSSVSAEPRTMQSCNEIGYF
jgi:hypothetical protein